MAGKPNPVQSAQARKAAMTRHHGANHPATMQAAQQARNAQAAQQLQQAVQRRGR